MTQTTISANFRQTFDIELHLTAQVTFNSQTADRVAQGLQFGFGKIAHTGIWIHARLSNHLLARRTTDPVDVGERNLDTLITRQIDTFNTSHKR